MTDPIAAVDRYLAALNEPDAGRRRALIEQAWTPDGSLTDPPIEGAGHDGLAAVGRHAPRALRRPPVRAHQPGRRPSRPLPVRVGARRPGRCDGDHRYGHRRPGGRRPGRRRRRLLRRARPAGLTARGHDFRGHGPGSGACLRWPHDDDADAAERGRRAAAGVAGAAPPYAARPREHHRDVVASPVLRRDGALAAEPRDGAASGGGSRCPARGPQPDPAGRRSRAGL